MATPVDRIIDVTVSGLPQPSAPFRWYQEVWGPVLRCAPLDRVAAHVFTTRSLFLDSGGTGAHWTRVSDVMGVGANKLIRLRQVHGTDVTVVHGTDGTPERHDGVRADIVLSAHPDVAVAVQVADCVPLLLADPEAGAVAAVHAGWRGLAAGAPNVAVRALVRAFGSRPDVLMAAVGPSIGPCCYEVGDDVREAFVRAGFEAADLSRWFVPGRDGRSHLDQWSATRDQLVEVGLSPDRIHLCDLCTRTHRSTFFSYREEGTAAGRMVGVIRAGASGLG